MRLMLREIAKVVREMGRRGDEEKREGDGGKKRGREKGRKNTMWWTAEEGIGAGG